MSCSNLTAGILDLCNDGFGGIEKRSSWQMVPVESFIETAGVVSDIVVNGSSLVPADFFKYEVPRQTSTTK